MHHIYILLLLYVRFVFPLCIHYTFSTCTCTCTYTIYSLYTLYIHALYIHSLFLHSFYLNYTCILHTLYIHCIYIIYIYCIHIRLRIYMHWALHYTCYTCIVGTLLVPKKPVGSRGCAGCWGTGARDGGNHGVDARGSRGAAGGWRRDNFSGRWPAMATVENGWKAMWIVSSLWYHFYLFAFGKRGHSFCV